MFGARLDAAYERYDLIAAEALFDVNAGDDLDPAWTDERDDQFANGAHAGVPKEKRPYSLRVKPLGWLAKQEVTVALDEPKTDTDDRRADEHGGHPSGRTPHRR
jgi:hypothetical protein